MTPAAPAAEPDQREAIAFLARRETYGVAVDAVERIDTHISIVFLAGDRAYKLKRNVGFSYLDFSTLAKREAACRAELALNRRTAPDLYLGVSTIARAADGSLALDGPGEVLDYVVVMRRFDQTLLFDRLAERGALTDALIEALSVEIARFHDEAEPTAGRGGRASLEIEIRGNEANLALAPEGAFAPGLCQSLVQRWDAELARHAAALDRRDEGGHVRRCHGDLHLRNICLWNGRPTLFDCIEFSEHLACIDVLYDLAFLLMDLRRRGLDAFANRAFNAYLDRNDETGGLGALPLMMSLRAGIRAHVGVAAARAQADAARRAAIVDEARQYLALADGLMRAAPPRLIAIGGVSGTGKSTLAFGLAPGIGLAPGARLLHTDALRKRLHGHAKTDRLSSDAYRPAVSERVYRLQREAAAAALRSGYSVVVDGVFARPDERAAIAATAREAGAAFAGLWLTADPAVLRERVAARTGDMSDATVGVLDEQLHYDLGTIEWARVEAGGDRDDVLASGSQAVESVSR